jgi:hypothetical protein
LQNTSFVVTPSPTTKDRIEEFERGGEADHNPVRGTLQAFFVPGEPVEMRYRTKSGAVGSGVYTNHEQYINDASAISDDPETEAVWFNLNKIPSDIAGNKHRLGAAAVKDEQIVRRKLILVDVEAKRPEEFKRDSATEEEKRQANAEAEKIGSFLDEFGIPYALADSGNGFHLLVRVDLPCNEEIDGLVHKFLKSLQRQVPTAKIDVAVHNRARVTKLYGTQTRKGRKLSDRPWRSSALLQDCNREPASANRLQRIIDAAPEAVAKPVPVRDNVAGSTVAPDFDMPDFLRHYSIEANQNGNYYNTTSCIMADRKHSGKPGKSGFYFDGQRLGWNCFSDDCAQYTIGDVIRKLNQAHPAYPKPIWPNTRPPRASAVSSVIQDERMRDDSARKPLDCPQEVLKGGHGETAPTVRSLNNTKLTRSANSKPDVEGPGFHRGARSTRSDVRVPKEKPCTLKRHFLGCLRQVIGLAEKLARNDPERFVWAGQQAFLKHAKKRDGKRGYSQRQVRYSLATAESYGVLTPARRVRNGVLRTGFIVEHHDRIMSQKGGRCLLSLRPSSTPPRAPGQKRNRISSKTSASKSVLVASGSAPIASAPASSAGASAGPISSEGSTVCRSDFLSECPSVPAQDIERPHDEQSLPTKCCENVAENGGVEPSHPVSPDKESPVNQNPANPSPANREGQTEENRFSCFLTALDDLDLRRRAKRTKSARSVALGTRSMR